MPRVKKVNKLMLWGFKSYKELDEYKNEAKKEVKKEPKKEVKNEAKKEVKKDVKREPFNLEENYGVEDLEFLNKEYDRIENILGKLDDMDKIEEYEELQDKLYQLIEGLEMMKKMQGGAVKTAGKTVKSTAKPITKEEVKKEVKTSKKPAKGSEEAKELGRRLAEARKKKREERGVVVIDEKKDYKKDLTPYYKFGEIPQGYRPATMEEAIRNNEIGEYGRFVVDDNVYYYYKKHTIMLNDNISDIMLNITLNGLKRRIMTLLNEIEIYKSRVDNDKYKDSIEENIEKLNEYKLSKKEVQGAYNYFLKEYAKRQNIPFVKASFKLDKPDVKLTKKVIYDVPKPKVIIDPRTNKPVDNRRVVSDNTLYIVKIGDEEMTLNKKYFENGKLKNKYALQLKKKNIIFREKYYNDDIKDEIFYRIM